MRTPHMTTETDIPVRHLDALESEAVHIFREVAGEFERPVILFSGGKDSILMLHLALKAFAPAPLPFSLLHVDTGHNFPEVLDYRDRTVAEHGLRLHVASVQDHIDRGLLRERPDGTRNPCRRRRSSRPSTPTASTPCSAAGAGTRRRPAPRNGCSASGTSSAAGTRAGSGRNCGSSTTAGTPRRARTRLPAVQLDRAGRVAVHRPYEDRGPLHLLRPRPRGLPARRHVADRG
ncbi:hypothetical protein SHKM778_25500 [Streptomyces sp. KM77-8]|uniref:Phosphoadenosine phosphosulphate reductase domain-containing protein n=1 Tax=Streptomyces haneummycinicus TaxID=3074435 RepID=A0AAT9HFI3_9ACTN